MYTATDYVINKESSFGEPNANVVNIEAAKDEYQSLKRELTHTSHQSVDDAKLEEGEAESEVFNLDEFLHGVSYEQRVAGHTPKHLGLIWKNLVVKGLGAEAHTISTVFSTMMSVVQFWKLFNAGNNNMESSKKTILKNLTGFCKDGEMLLVLGRPGSGCTSLLKVLSNMRSSFTDVDGDISFGGIDAATFAKNYRGQTCYNEEEDQHHPTLTVKQTLQFSLRTRTPGARLPDESKPDFVNRILYMLGNMLGLTKQMDTLVGNAFIRGLSGGERKRLSIAEQMTTQSSINCWDCSTRGLDAASALDFVRSLRIMTDIFNKTTVATLYQASSSIFNLFDKVLLLDDGRCIYFGPTTHAKSYFENLGFYYPPRKSIPDFLTGVCNPLEREIRSGFESSVPQHAHEFEKCYFESKMYKSMMAELSAYEQRIEQDKHADRFKQAVREEHQKRASNSTPYIVSFYQQVKALTIRQYHILIKDKEALILRYGTILTQALITASCFYKMPLSGTGAFSRGGALFFALLFNALISQTELVRYLTGRPILEKHKQYALYRPSAFYIAQVIIDIPYAVAQVLLFEICSYFMMGLHLSVNRFFTYFIVLFFINMTMNGFFRLFGSISSSYSLAIQVSGVLFIAAVTYIGYIVPKSKMHPWLSWIFWLDPITYSYKALLVNEIHGQQYTCEGVGNAIPFGPGYNDWNYKTCTMTGGVPGQDHVDGDTYLKQAFDYDPSSMWAPDFVVGVAFFLCITFLCAAAMEFGGTSKVGSLTKLYLPGKAPRVLTPEEEDERRREQACVSDEMDTIATGTTFSWQHVNYTIPVGGGRLQLLNNISGIVKPGHLTALMGSSGAGKTTLLDVLARRKTVGKVEGRIYLNGEALMRDFERVTSYCEQTDVLQPADTVREALRFSAYLRQPSNVPKAEKDDYVEKIIQLLEMDNIADAQVGEPGTGFGISIEERKRLTVGMELVSKPKLLFLDEPTSGLDSQSSYNIIRFIRKLADAGWPVLCTIHQPSAILFEQFDHLLLIVRDGKMAYHGEIGPDAQIMINYFESNGGPKCSPKANPAEYILDVVGAGTVVKAAHVTGGDWAEIWAKSPEAQALEEELEQIHRTADRHPIRKTTTYATSAWKQFVLVHRRMALAYWRSPGYNLGRLLNVTLNSLLIGFTFWKLGNSISDLPSKLFAFLSNFIICLVFLMLCQPKFMMERSYFRREYASRYYSWLPWSVSIVLVEIPYILVYSAFYTCCFYWTAGMQNDFQSVIYFYITFNVILLWSITLSFVIGAYTESPNVAATIDPSVICILILFCGLMQPASAIPHFWKSWIYWLDPFHYYLEGMVVNELENINIICTEADLVKFYPPPGQTCGEYLTNFIQFGAPGYLSNPNATQPELCGYCAYKSGKEFYTTQLEWDGSHKWRNLGFLIAFLIFNVIVLIGLVFLKRKAKR
ncbi:hypothetical protein DFQ30_011013 [Apophysomyces sp. BC1015]|nr:hypothetical protein DFQ30_011013 [Apophysomyces sp. BC1015]